LGPALDWYQGRFGAMGKRSSRQMREQTFLSPTDSKKRLLIEKNNKSELLSRDPSEQHLLLSKLFLHPHQIVK